MPFLGVGGVLWPKLAIETPTTRRNLRMFWRWTVTRSDASHHRRYCLTTCWARYLQKGWSKFPRCGTRCGGRSESVGRADFSRRPPWFASKRECLGVISQGYLYLLKISWYLYKLFLGSFFIENIFGLQGHILWNGGSIIMVVDNHTIGSPTGAHSTDNTESYSNNHH